MFMVMGNHEEHHSAERILKALDDADERDAVRGRDDRLRAVLRNVLGF